MRQATGLKSLCRLPAPEAPAAHTRPVGGSALRSRPRDRRCVLAAQPPTSAVQMASPRCAIGAVAFGNMWTLMQQQMSAPGCQGRASVKPLPSAAQHAQRTCAAPVWFHCGYDCPHLSVSIPCSSSVMAPHCRRLASAVTWYAAAIRGATPPDALAPPRALPSAGCDAVAAPARVRSSSSPHAPCTDAQSALWEGTRFMVTQELLLRFPLPNVQAPHVRKCIDAESCEPCSDVVAPQYRLDASIAPA